MALLLHHRETPTRVGTIARALLTLVLVTAVVASAAGLAAYAVAKVLVTLLG